MSRTDGLLIVLNGIEIQANFEIAQMSNELLIVLNGIEIYFTAQQLAEYITLLIVLNGIEIQIENLSSHEHLSFNRTKWN